MRRFVVALLGLLLALPSAFALDKQQLVGTWKLVSLEGRFQDGRPPSRPMGERPLGMLIYTAQDRLMVVIEGEGRKPPKDDADRVALFNSLTAYTGIYRVEGDRLIFKADVASSPSVRGAEIGRLYKLDGDRLEVIQDPAPAANLPGNPMVTWVSVWQRVR